MHRRQAPSPGSEGQGPRTRSARQIQRVEVADHPTLELLANNNLEDDAVISGVDERRAVVPQTWESDGGIFDGSLRDW